MRADTGPIGGDLSHEFQILAETGESEVFCDRALARDRHPRRATSITTAISNRSSGTGPASTPRPTKCTTRKPARSRPDELVTARGIEVGHIFYFGTKYSQPMGAVVDRAERRGGGARNGLLRHRRVAPGRRADRGEPRRCRHHLAGERRAVPPRPDQSARRRRQMPPPPPTTSTASCATPGSRCCTTTATSRPAPNSPRWI